MIRPKSRGLTFLAALALTSLLSGCFSLSWAHNRRHVRKVIDELTGLHQDIDFMLFDLDRNPAE